MDSINDMATTIPGVATVFIPKSSSVSAEWSANQIQKCIGVLANMFAIPDQGHLLRYCGKDKGGLKFKVFCKDHRIVDAFTRETHPRITFGEFKLLMTRAFAGNPEGATFGEMWPEFKPGAILDNLKEHFFNPSILTIFSLAEALYLNEKDTTNRSSWGTNNCYEGVANRLLGCEKEDKGAPLEDFILNPIVLRKTISRKEFSSGLALTCDLRDIPRYYIFLDCLLAQIMAKMRFMTSVGCSYIDAREQMSWEYFQKKCKLYGSEEPTIPYPKLTLNRGIVTIRFCPGSRSAHIVTSYSRSLILRFGTDLAAVNLNHSD